MSLYFLGFFENFLGVGRCEEAEHEDVPLWSGMELKCIMHSYSPSIFRFILIDDYEFSSLFWGELIPGLKIRGGNSFCFGESIVHCPWRIPLYFRWYAKSS